MKDIILSTAIGVFVIFSLAGCGNSGEKVYRVNELVEKAAADKDGWLGKEVTVSAYVWSTGGPGGRKGYSLSMKDHRNDESERQLSCAFPQGDPPEGILDTTVVVTGKVVSVHSQNYLNLKSVKLDACELRK